MPTTLLGTQELFANRYRVEKLLGSGSMGDVYLARDTLLQDELIALKLMSTHGEDNEQHVERFLREVKLARKVANPFVVKTFDFGRADDLLYFTMEHVPGKSLKDLIKERGRLDMDTACRILKATAIGLAAIHELGVVHRDLKPANILLDDELNPKIADFGVAKPPTSSLTAQDEIVGSAAYLAPECWLGKDIGSYSDLYALGVIAYEMLSGELPYQADSPAQMMWLHLETQPPALAREVSPGLRGMVLALLEKDLDKRPMNAGEVANFLSADIARPTFDAVAQFSTLPAQRSTLEPETERRSRGYIPTSAEKDDNWSGTVGIGARISGTAAIDPKVKAKASVRDFQPVSFSGFKREPSLSKLAQFYAVSRGFIEATIPVFFAVGIIALLYAVNLFSFGINDVRFGTTVVSQILVTAGLAFPFGATAAIPLIFLMAVAGYKPDVLFRTALLAALVFALSFFLFGFIHRWLVASSIGQHFWSFQEAFPIFMGDYRFLLKLLLFTPVEISFFSQESLNRLTPWFIQLIYSLILARQMSLVLPSFRVGQRFLRLFSLVVVSLLTFAYFGSEAISIFVGSDYGGIIKLRVGATSVRLARASLLWGFAIVLLLSYFTVVFRLFLAKNTEESR